MTLLSHRVKSSSCKVGTRPVGFMPRYSAVSVLPNEPPKSGRSNGRFSSPRPQSTFITLLDVARPQTIRRMAVLRVCRVCADRIRAAHYRQLARWRLARHMRRMPTPSLRTLALLSAVLAGVALGTALASEEWGGLVPCALCLLERWPYRIAIALGLLAVVLPPRLARVLLVALVLCLLADAALAVV